MKLLFLLAGACLLVFSLCTPAQAQEERVKDNALPMIKDLWGNDVRATPGLYEWDTMVMHIAIGENGLSWGEKKSDIYKNENFPLYCGYVQFFDNHTLEFVNKSGLPLESVSLFFKDMIRYKGLLLPLHNEYGYAPEFMYMDDPSFFKYFRFHMVSQGIRTVKKFPGDSGKDFVPVFKHQYPYGTKPPADVYEFELEN